MRQKLTIKGGPRIPIAIALDGVPIKGVSVVRLYLEDEFLHATLEVKFANVDVDVEAEVL